MNGQMSQFTKATATTATVLLRGGHRWLCRAADAQDALDYLRAPGADPVKMLVLRAPDGQTLTVPAREIVGVVDDSRPAPVSSMFISAQQVDRSLPLSPFVLIENFLDAENFKQVMNFAFAHEATYAAATVTSDDADYRRAKVMFDVTEVLPLFMPKIQALVPALWPLLGISPVTVKNIECQLTAHGAGDFFKRHNDNGSPETAGRTISYVYYFHREPKAFSGGHLRMFETVVADNYYQCGKAHKDIEPKANSLIAFPSYIHHEVTPVKTTSKDFADLRFTLNGWVVRDA